MPLDSRPHVEGFDRYDLLVIKELQKDSLQHLTGIAKKLKVHQKTLGVPLQDARSEVEACSVIYNQMDSRHN